eukprot:GGOE01036915.1.p1 GENE.GGOE01036915.1~~GGOE01036915.1.p1  ORF type:complete len:455 (-),score=99.11 GGOE01036915.1:157-1521(-)
MNATTTSSDTLFTWDDWDWSLEAAAPLVLIALALWVIIFKTLAWATALFLEHQYPLPEVVEKDGELFCYSCSNQRKAKELVILPPEERGHGQDVALQCSDCGRFLHPRDWLPELVDLFTDYHRCRRELGAQPLPLNPRFPMSKFVTKPELMTFLIIFVTAAFNCYTIISKFLTEISTKDPTTRYLLLLRALAIGELCIVILVFCQCVWLSLKTTVQYRRQRPFRVFLGLLLANSGKMANANVLSVIRMWDIHRVVRFASVAGHVEHDGPDCWGIILQTMQYIMLGPAVVLFLFGPGVALLIRLFQLEPVTAAHVVEWDRETWIAFFSFLNNFRYLVTRLDVVGRLGAHLLSSTVYFLFAELMDVTSGGHSLLQCIVLLITSSPSECYELFKGSSNIWLSPPLDPGTPTQDASPIDGTAPAAGHQPPGPQPAYGAGVPRRRLGPVAVQPAAAARE